MILHIYWNNLLLECLSKGIFTLFWPWCTVEVELPIKSSYAKETTPSLFLILNTFDTLNQMIFKQSCAYLDLFWKKSKNIDVLILSKFRKLWKGLLYVLNAQHFVHCILPGSACEICRSTKIVFIITYLFYFSFQTKLSDIICGIKVIIHITK